MDIVLKIYKRRALTIKGMSRLFLVGMVQFRIHSLFAYIACGRRIGDNLFSLTAGRDLAFHQRHGAAVDRSKLMRVFKKENTVKKGKQRKCLCWRGRRCLCLEYEGVSLKYQRH